MLKMILDYILVEERIRSFFDYLAWILPVVCILCGVIIGSVRQSLKQYVLKSILWGLIGPGIWIMWQIYTRLIDHYGIDSVKGLLVILLVFIVSGVVVGFSIRFFENKFGDRF